MKNVFHSALKMLALSCAAACFLPATGQSTKTLLTTEEAEQLCATINMQRTSIHDPSIVYNEKGKNYYIFGSHMAVAKTNDLQNWSWVTVPWGTVNDNGTIVSGTSPSEAFRVNQTKTVTVNGQETTFGNFDAAGWNCAVPGKDENGNAFDWTVDGNMWPPTSSTTRQWENGANTSA